MNREKVNRYQGGKNGEGVYQRIINLIPPHKVWVEACAGSAAVTRYIYPAAQSYVFEAEHLQANRLKNILQERAVVINNNFMEVIDNYLQDPVDSFIYVDPPYLKLTRRDKRNIYKVEWSEEEHKDFLWWVNGRKENILITHPRCKLYMTALNQWNTLDYEYRSRVGMLKDCIWFNYSVPEVLHDYSYVGSNRTERQRIQRKIKREIERLNRLPVVERNAIIDAISRKFETINHSSSPALPGN